ncbi:hypothetical protein PUN28_006545 [Cardiocondyla obscurior]|uniref:Secreted protein n=1 Tax=Cardiocondyla obscurior TaxID=286306 RepID=A0AAW2GB32_9HYME
MESVCLCGICAMGFFSLLHYPCRRVEFGLDFEFALRSISHVCITDENPEEDLRRRSTNLTSPLKWSMLRGGEGGPRKGIEHRQSSPLIRINFFYHCRF